jgi:NAD(P)-dependent dehydrogenase (short-subunit alcohol dehydrogenase family)
MGLLDVTGSAARAHTTPRHVAVIGAAGGLGQGILRVCRAEGVGFTAIVRSRPERIGAIPEGSRAVIVPSLSDQGALTAAFRGADAVLTAMGVTTTSGDRGALLSANMATLEAAMIAAGVDRILVINTLLTSLPGARPSWLIRLFARVPGTMGRGATELQAVVDALGAGAFSSLRWTLVRAGVNARGADEPPVAHADWAGAANSWRPVSYEAMGRWMLAEAHANGFVRGAPLVSRAKPAKGTRGRATDGGDRGGPLRTQ